MRYNRKSGQTALSLVFVIGGLILLFATTLAFLALSFLNSVYGLQSANRADAIAMGGLNDAILQIERNKDFASSGHCVPYYASLPCPSGYAQVTVVQGSPTSDRVTVTTDASVSRYRRKIQGIFAVNPTSSLVTTVSIEEIKL